MNITTDSDLDILPEAFIGLFLPEAFVDPKTSHGRLGVMVVAVSAKQALEYLNKK